MNSMERDFQTAVPDALKALSLEPSEEIAYSHKPLGRDDIEGYHATTSCDDKHSDGKGLYVHISTDNRPLTLTPRHVSNPALWTPNSEYSLRGLLPDMQATLYRDGPPLSRALKLDVRAMSSVKTINYVASLLELAPGIGVFELVSEPGKRQYTASEWTVGLQDHKLRVADTTEWYFAVHDRFFYDHVQSWFSSSPQVSKVIAQTARAHCEQAGNNISASGNAQSLEIRAFAGAVDDLASFTHPIFKELLAINGIARSAQISQRESLLEPTNFDHTMHLLGLREDTIFDEGRAKTLRTLGLIDIAKAPFTKRELLAEYLSHVSKLFLRLDDVRPIPDINPVVATQKRTIFRNIQETSRPELAQVA